MAKPWKVTFGKGQWMITSRDRVWILSPWIILLRTVVVICAIFALAYSARLLFNIFQSDAEIARIGTVTNMYMNKNSREAERREQILLFAQNVYTKRSDSTPDHEARALRKPYPSVFQMEQQLGRPDVRDLDENGPHLTWNQVIWQKPPEWPARSKQYEKWPSVTNRILEAWFDKQGFIIKMVLIRREPDGRIATEYIGRLPSDWNVQRFDP
jgi:hypothetical protein